MPARHERARYEPWAGRLTTTPGFLGAVSRRRLATEAKMAAAARDRIVPDQTPASEAFFPIALIDAMARLEGSLLPIGILVIGNRRAFQAYCLLQDLLHRSIEPAHFCVRQLRADFLRMDLREPESLVRIDVPHPADHTLIQQQRLDL